MALPFPQCHTLYTETATGLGPEIVKFRNEDQDKAYGGGDGDDYSVVSGSYLLRPGA